MSKLPLFILNNFYVPSQKEKQFLIDKIVIPKIKFNNNNYGEHNVEFVDKLFNKIMYQKFINVSKQLLNNFTLHKNNNNKAYVYCTNKNDYHHVWHDHKNTCSINSVYYLKIPSEEKGQLEIEHEGNRFDFFPKENDFIIFPSYLKHAPKKPNTEEYRISINFELLCNEKTEDIFK